MTESNPSPSLDASTDGRSWSALAVVSALIVAVLGFFPIANWIPGGHEADWYATLVGEWMNGALITVGGALVLTILSRRLPLWRNGLVSPLVRRAHAFPRLTGLVIGSLAFALYAFIAWHVLSARPLFIDEISQQFQARIFASGRLWLPAPEHPEFTSILHILDDRGKWFSQFPPGGPLMMTPGIWLGAPWLIDPAAGAVSAALFWGVARRVEPRPAVALGAALLMAMAPFVAFLASSHMNHALCGMWVMVSAYALTRMTEQNASTDENTSRPLFAALAGFGFGAAASIRPVDAFAFALPAGVWILVRTVQRPARFRELLAAGIGVAIPASLLLVYNDLTTGHPLLFAYEQLWGKEHGLGFHQAPYGLVHTPARGIELLNLYFLRLQSYLFETPLPSLVPSVIALAIAPRLHRIDRYFLASVAFLLALYFAYWHDGFYLGPRFVYLAAPFFVLWTARSPAYIRERWPNYPQLHRGAVFALLVSGAFAVFSSIPYRAAQYARGLRSLRVDYTAVAREARIENALILVRESWGSQLMSRMWAVGVPHGMAEGIYRSVDACALDETLSGIEQRSLHGDNAVALLIPLLRDSARVVRSELSPDRSERMLPGSVYTARCHARIQDDREGFTLLAPLMAANWGSNIYARDLHARDTLLLKAYAGRRVYLLRPSSGDDGAPLRLQPLRTDSLKAVWTQTP